MSNSDLLLWYSWKRFTSPLQDIHGNTALHIAVAMGRKDCIQLLLAHNSPVKLKNTQGKESGMFSRKEERPQHLRRELSKA